MSLLADQWHDPAGPLREHRSPTAQDGVDFVRMGYLAALNERFIKSARAAGMSEELIRLITETSQG